MAASSQPATSTARSRSSGPLPSRSAQPPRRAEPLSTSASLSARVGARSRSLCSRPPASYSRAAAMIVSSRSCRCEIAPRSRDCVQIAWRLYGSGAQNLRRSHADCVSSVPPTRTPRMHARACSQVVSAGAPGGPTAHGRLRLLPLFICRGHSASVTHLDWSADARLIMSNCAAHEVLCWGVPHDATHRSQPRERPAVQTLRPVRQAAQLLADSCWASWTCVLGFPTMGIWPDDSDGTDVNAVRERCGREGSAAEGWSVMATLPLTLRASAPSHPSHHRSSAPKWPPHARPPTSRWNSRRFIAPPTAPTYSRQTISERSSCSTRRALSRTRHTTRARATPPS